MPFIMTGTSDCVAHHTTAHQSAAAGGTALSHHVIISQGRHRCPESERESANANQYFYSFLISTEAEHGFLYVSLYIKRLIFCYLRTMEDYESEWSGILLFAGG